MKKEDAAQIFNEMGGDTYDKNNTYLKPVSDSLQLLILLVLKKLPKRARILCVGVGTGADILGLAEAYPEWSFVGIDPAKSMLTKCEEKLRKNGLMSRCELFQGFLEDYKSEEKFDAIVCLFVLHFVKDRNERGGMFLDFASRLKKGGYLVNAEISVDIQSPEYRQLIENWKALHGFTGANEEKLANIPNVVEKQLGVISPEQTKEMIINSGFEEPVRFFQAFLISGWYSKKA